MRKLYVLLFTLFMWLISNAQLSGTKSIPGDYADLAAAITDLNTQGVGPGGVTLNLIAANPQTAPAGGYVIGGTGTALLTTTSLSNAVTIQGNGNTITSSAALVAGDLNDGIFKIIGADWITITGFTMVEDLANTTTTAASNNMTEWGVALLYVTTTDGAQNNTIRGNTIDLSRTYQNTFGIYSNSTHSATAVTTSATATTTAGANSGLKIYSNNITDVNHGIVIVGPTAAADNNDGIEIGVTAPNANTITNFGTTATFSAYANVSATINGILVRNSKNYNISYNTITSSNGGVTSGTLNGIQIPAFSNAPTGTFTNTISYNILSLRSGVAAGAMNGINSAGTSASATSTLSITNNDFNNFGHTVSGTAAISFIINAGAHQFQNITGNTFTNISVNTTGSITFINNDNSNISITGVKNVNNNSIVTGFTKTGGGGTVRFFTDGTSGSDANGATSNVNNNIINNLSVTGATTLTLMEFINGNGATSSPNKTFSGNTISNITGGTSAVTCLLLNWGAATDNINNNSFNTIINGSTITGISTSTSGTPGAGSSWNIFQNTVYSFTGSGTGTVSAISIASAVTRAINISNNKIYNLENSNAAGAVNAISLASGTTITVYNNIIGDLRTPAVSAANALNAINITSTTATSTINVSFNTIYLNGTSTGANFGSSGIFHTTSATATTATLNLRNNIIVNTSTANGTGFTVAYRRSNATLTNYGSASNNNLFYAGAPGATNLIFYDGTNSDQTLAAFKARVAPRDASSISESPNFVSTTGSNPNFLHINTSIATQIENGGTPVAGITLDFDGDTRNASTPDIGADEFAGIPIDITAPTIAYTPLLGACTGGARTLIATITDASGVPTTGVGLPVLYYSVNGGPYISSQGISIGSNQYQFSLGAGTVTGDVVTYFVVAQDNASTPNVGSSPSAGAGGFTANPPAASTPPTSPNSYATAPMSGTYTVGAGGNYTTLTAAVADYNSRCLSGAVIFNLTDATYPSEAFPISILNNPMASAVNTLTIKPAAGISPLITGSSANSIFRMIGTDYVTIDGSNNGTTSRNLTINNTNTGTNSNLIWISNASALDSASFNTVKNCVLTGNSSVSTFAAIVQSGTTLGGVAESQNNNNTYENNGVNKVFYGIAMVGPTTLETGNRILNNFIGTSNVADTIGLNGIAVFQQQNAVISRNTIQGVITTSTSTTSGIRIAGSANGIMVSRNNILRIRNTNSGGYGSNGIQLNSSSTAAGVTVVNNYVSDVASNGYTLGALVTDNGYGIIAVTGGGYNIYYNTVVLNTNQTAAGIPAALNIASSITTAASIDLRNNHLINTQTTTGARYAIYSGAANTVFSNINYNNYYSTGANLGFIGSDRADLAAVQAGFGGNINSTAILPVFVSATDLRMNLSSNAALDNTGTPIAGITTDFDNVGRSATTPDVGADEFTTGGTLPANLLSFSGVRKGNANQLKWIVAQELDVASYELERSENGRTWSRAGVVTSLGNTTAQRTYNFTDNNISGLKQFYRLRQLDRNGSQRLSNIVVITGEKPVMLTLNGLFPNPAATQISLLVGAPAKDNVTIVIVDAVGRIVKVQKASVGEGSNTLQVNVTGLSQGSYMVKVTSENNSETTVSRFVKE